MADLIETLVGFVSFLIMISLGYFIGRRNEDRHYRSIQDREQKLLSLPVVAMKNALDDQREVAKVELVSGGVVISIDYFKRFLANLRNFFGGRLTSYESLLDRARREAILRMKEAAKGADVIVNFRLENLPIGKETKGSVGCVEMFAYGTAVTYAATPPTASQVSQKATPTVQPGVRKPEPAVAQATSPKPGVRRPEPGVGQAAASPQAAAESRYRVVFSGEIAPGQDLERVKANVAALYKISLERCEEMFSRPVATIKNNVDYQTAQKYKAAFEKTGAVCRIEKIV